MHWSRHINHIVTFFISVRTFNSSRAMSPVTRPSLLPDWLFSPIMLTVLFYDSISYCANAPTHAFRLTHHGRCCPHPSSRNFGSPRWKWILDHLDRLHSQQTAAFLQTKMEPPSISSSPPKCKDPFAVSFLKYIKIFNAFFSFHHWIYFIISSPNFAVKKAKNPNFFD